MIDCIMLETKALIDFVLQDPRIKEELSAISELVGYDEFINTLIKALREAKEKIAVERYKEGKITLSELKRVLNVSEWEIDDILKKYGVYRKYEL